MYGDYSCIAPTDGMKKSVFSLLPYNIPNLYQLHWSALTFKDLDERTCIKQQKSSPSVTYQT